MSDLDIHYQNLPAQDLETALDLETKSYPESEAGTLDSFSLRQREAGDLFLGAYLQENENRTLVGFVCGTATASSSLTHDSMATHDSSPDARFVAIHSVVTSPDYRRKGIASAMLREYIKRLESVKDDKNNTDPRWDGILLIAHEELIGFYKSVGFYLVGKSSVQHGPRDWYEMAKDNGRSTNALPWRSFIPSDTDSNTPPSSVLDQNGMNAHTLRCPCRHCESLILLPGKAKWVSRSKSIINHSDIPPTQRRPDFPPKDNSSNEEEFYWCVPSPMAFENIGFSRNVGTVKYLSCADCECGPIGYHDTQGNDLGKQVHEQTRGGKPNVGVQEFLIGFDRVRYSPKK